MEHGIKVKANLFFCSYLIFESNDRHFHLINLKVFCQHTSMEKEKETSFTLKTAAYFATCRVRTCGLCPRLHEQSTEEESSQGRHSSDRCLFCSRDIHLSHLRIPVTNDLVGLDLTRYVGR
jgi:hypothetical protein